jgi:hypothetical protein
MSAPTTKPDGIESQIALIADPAARRAMRALQQEVVSTLSKQQTEIDALLEMMMEKHVGSLGEFKRHLVRLQQNHSRGDRIHDILNSASAAMTPHPAAPNLR